MNKNIIYVLLAGLGKIFGELVYRMDNDIKNHPFIIGIASAFGMCFSLIPLIYFKTKSEKPNKRILLSFHYYKKHKKCKKYLLILVVAFLDFAQKFLTFLFVDDIDYNFWIFDMICLSILSYFILHNKLYIHKYLSLIIMIILGISLNIIIYLHGFFTEIKPFTIGLILLKEFIFCLNIIIIKYSMSVYYCIPYEIIFTKDFLP